MQKILTEVSRILVGSLFILSGLIKSNDILGFVYKLEEYFEPGALNMEGLIDYALPIAILVVIGEIMLGVAILVGALPKLTTVLTLFLLVFFAWLTYYTANCDDLAMVTIMENGVATEIPIQCVSECGCFGNAIPLTPWQSFYKDLALLFVFIPFVIAVIKGRIKLNTSVENKYIIPAALVMISLFSYTMIDWLFPIMFAGFCLLAATMIARRIEGKKAEYMIAIAVLLICGIFQYWTFSHLPVKDYRPYAVGENIRENMKTAEEVGKEPPVYAIEYLFTNVHTKKDTVIMSNDYLKLYKEESFKNTYEVKSYDGRSIKIKDGYDPRIMDLAPQTFEGNEMLDDVLQDGYVMWFVSKSLSDVDSVQIEGLKQLAEDAQNAGVKFYGLVNATYETADEFRHKHQLNFELLETDFIELKIIIRSNPGIVLLKDATVLEKYSWKDIPTFDEVKESHW